MKILKSLTKYLVNKLRFRPLVDFIVAKPYVKPTQSNWDRWGMEGMSAIGLERWFLFFTVIYAIFVETSALVIIFVIKTYNDILFATKAYAESGSAIAAKYSVDSSQALIFSGAQLLIIPVFAYILYKIISSIK